LALLLRFQVIQLKPQKPLQEQLQSQHSGEEPVAMDTCTPTASAAGAAADAAQAAVAAAAAGSSSDGGGGPDAMQQDTPRPQGPSEAAAAAGLVPASALGGLMDGSNSGVRGGLGAAFGAQQQQQLGGGGGLQYTLKFETQMYKIREDEYSVDIQVRCMCVFRAGSVSGCAAGWGLHGTVAAVCTNVMLL
jgi:hypothetical protein